MALSPLARGQATFFTPPTYAGGSSSGSQTLYVADFNGDGKPDILTPDGTLNLGNGDGTFKLGSAVIGGIAAVGDFNGDGIPDVLEQGTGTLLVLLGNGDGTFKSAISTNSGATLQVIVAGDVNGDGKADVLGLYNNNLLVYLSNGDGTFAAGVPYALGITSSAYTAITLDDFNGDKKIDVTVSLSGNNAPGQEIVLLGNGDGTFQAGKSSTGVIYPISVVAGDFNGDGKLDLVIASEPACNGTCTTASTSILLGNGDGTFQAPTTIFVNDSNGNTTGVLLAAADVNGDGKLDLVLSNTENSGLVQIYLGKGDGTFSNTYSYFPAPDDQSVVSGLAIGDFNLDGKPDVAASNNILLGNGDGTFQGWPLAPGLPAATVSDLAIGSFVKNGPPGVAVVCFPGSPTDVNGVYIFANDGKGNLSLAQTYTLQQPPYEISAADLNGDGNLDLVALSSDPISQDWAYSVLLGNGDGTFQPPAFYPQNIPAGGYAPIIVADFNNDGKPDLAFPAGNSSVAVVLGKGDGTFGSPAYFYDAGGSAMVGADFNSDGKLDIAAAVSSGLALLLGNGDGTFQPAEFPISTSLTNLLTADLNGDGKADLVSGNLVFLGNGNGTFTALAGALPTPLSVSILADINGDGKPDAIGSEATLSHALSWGFTLGNGDGTFGSFTAAFPSFTGIVTPGPVLLAAADMNDDGKPDLIGSAANGIFVILNTSAPAAGTAFSPSTLMFPSQAVGSSSASAPVALTNSGTAPLTVTGVTLGGAGAAEFAETNNCTIIQPSASCIIYVTFTPTAAGAISANLIVADNAGSGSQVVVVSGTASSTPDFTIGMASGGSSSSTITAGQAATFGLTITPTGSFSGTVNLTCSVAPAASPAPICSLPASVNVTGSAATSVTATVSTTASGKARSVPAPNFPSNIGLTVSALAIGTLSLILVATKRRRLVISTVTVLVAVAMAGCGGSSSTPPVTTAQGTPPGTYTVTITATSGSLSHQTKLTVIIQ
jgi:hypothetical protein